MKCIRVRNFGTPEVLCLEDRKDLRPDPGQVLIQVKAAGVNPVDTYIRSGTYSQKPELPYTPGLDAAGIVETVGEGIKRIFPGDRVYATGTISGSYAEQALCKESQLHILPPTVSYSQGASIGIPYATAYHALVHCAQVQPKESVLIHGASGGVGLACIQLARSFQMNIIGTAGSKAGLTLVDQQGADHVLDHRKTNHLDEVISLTDGRGVDVILEMLANKNLPQDLPALATGGRLVIIGSRGTTELDPRQIMIRGASIIGMFLFNISEKNATNIHDALEAGLNNGTLNPVVGQEIPLVNAADSHEAVINPPAYGKIVLIP